MLKEKGPAGWLLAGGWAAPPKLKPPWAPGAENEKPVVAVVAAVFGVPNVKLPPAAPDPKLNWLMAAAGTGTGTGTGPSTAGTDGRGRPAPTRHTAPRSRALMTDLPPAPLPRLANHRPDLPALHSYWLVSPPLQGGPLGLAGESGLGSGARCRGDGDAAAGGPGWALRLRGGCLARAAARTRCVCEDGAAPLPVRRGQEPLCSLEAGPWGGRVPRALWFPSSAA